MKQHTITLRAGQGARLRVEILAPETATPEQKKLTAAVYCMGESLRLEESELEGCPTLHLPILPIGLHLYELRVGGLTALYGHVEILPSPLADLDDEPLIDITHDTLASHHISIELREGPRGKSAYETWLDLGNEGDEQAFIDSLRPEWMQHISSNEQGITTMMLASDFKMIYQRTNQSVMNVYWDGNGTAAALKIENLYDFNIGPSVYTFNVQSTHYYNPHQN